jgi:dephospho-CoA kinase
MAKYFKNPLIVAVTGGIGSGQSTVCQFFKEWRCKVINADLKAKQVIQKDAGLKKDLRRFFGNDIFYKDGKLNTKRLAELAFRDELNTQKLNQLVHPRMVETLIEEMEQARFSGRYPIILIDAALVFEISIEQMFDAAIVVNASDTAREKRVMERDQMSKAEFKARADKQIPLSEKVKWADFVIDNNGSLEDLKKRTRDVYDRLMEQSKKSNR